MPLVPLPKHAFLHVRRIPVTKLSKLVLTSTTLASTVCKNSMERNRFTTISPLYRGPVSLWLCQVPNPSISFPGHLSGICKFLENLLQMPYGGARIFVQIPLEELREDSKCPDLLNKVKFYYSDGRSKQ